MIDRVDYGGGEKTPTPPTSGSGVNSAGYSSSIYDALQAISESNNSWNQNQVDAVNAFNAEEAAKNRKWQERMARNAHQYEVEDLIKAGLNPVLSAGGQGSAVGSGAVASGQKAVADNTYGQGLISLMAAAIAASSAQNVAQINAATNLKIAEMKSGDQQGYNETWKQITDMNNSVDIVRAITSLIGTGIKIRYGFKR